MDDVGIPYVVVATKADKLNPEQMNTALIKLREKFNLPLEQPIPFSSITGFGKKQLWHAIRKGILGDVELDNVENSELGVLPNEEL